MTPDERELFEILDQIQAAEQRLAEIRHRMRELRAEYPELPLRGTITRG